MRYRTFVYGHKHSGRYYTIRAADDTRAITRSRALTGLLGGTGFVTYDTDARGFARTRVGYQERAWTEVKS